MKLPPLFVCALAAKTVAVVLWLAGAGPWLGAAFFFGPDPFVFYAFFAPSAQGLCRVLTRFATERREVWLTIDDGPDPDDTPKILDLLDRHGAKATFFVIGERAARWPDLIREIVRRGHQIGHHTQTHPVGTFWCASPRRLGAELDLALATLHTIGVRPQWFRAPVGIKHLLLAPALVARNLQCVAWTIRSGDCRSRSPEAMVAVIADRLHPGAIVLLHEGPSVPAAVRVAGIARLLDVIAERKLACVIPRADQLR